MPAVDLVGGDAQAVPGDAAEETGREQAIIRDLHQALELLEHARTHRL